METQEEKIYYLSKKMLVELFVYYAILSVIGSIISVYIAIKVSKENNFSSILKDTFFIAIATSIIFCSVVHTALI